MTLLRMLVLLLGFCWWYFVEVYSFESSSMLARVRSPPPISSRGGGRGGIRPEFVLTTSSLYGSEWPRTTTKLGLLSSSDSIQQNERQLVTLLHAAAPGNDNEPQEGESDVINGSTTTRATTIPHPPTTPPPASVVTFGAPDGTIGSGDGIDDDEDSLQDEYQSLLEQYEQSDAAVRILERRVDELSADLSKKESELNKGRDAWSLEKTSLVAKLAELQQAWTFQKQEQEAVDAYEKEEEEQERERLEREVGILQNELTTLHQALRVERETSDQVKSQLLNLEDKYEFQQMEFEKEKKTLEETVAAERTKLEQIQATFNRDTTKFQQEKEKMVQELRRETARLTKAKEEWTSNQRAFEKEQASLQQQVREQEERLEQTQTTLSTERNQFKEERETLQATIAQEQQKLRNVEQELRDETSKFTKVQEELERTIAKEQAAVAGLNKRLEEQQERFRKEKLTLETRIEVEQERLIRVEQQLAEEQLEFQNTKTKLEGDVAEGARLLGVKKKHMNRRYETIRKEMTRLWEGAKRDARKERTRLEEKYKTKLSELEGSVEELQVAAERAKASNSELQTLLVEMERQKEAAEDETVRVEQRYTAMLAQRNEEIAHLQTNLDTLRRTVTEQKEQLNKYESSFREIFKLSLRLTGRRIRKGGSRVKGWVVKKPSQQRKNKKSEHH